MNNLFARLFGFILNIVHILFVLFMFLWFFQGIGQQYAFTGDVILSGVIIFIVYIVTMGFLTTIVSIRENLAEMNEKLSKIKRSSSFESKERIEPRL